MQLSILNEKNQLLQNMNGIQMDTEPTQNSEIKSASEFVNP